jgi:hypothetical protein
MLHSMGYCDFSLYQNKHYDNLVVLRPSNWPLMPRVLFCCLTILPNNNCEARPAIPARLEHAVAG